MHNLLVLGATGPTGRIIVSQALEQGHTVAALARRPDRLVVDHPRLTRLAADVTVDNDALVRGLAGRDAVVSALGRGQSFKSQALMTTATPRIVSAMEQAGISRLIWISAYGVGGSAPNAPWPFRLMFGLVLRDIYADKARAEAIIRASRLTWTILAPVLLTDGARTKDCRRGEDLQIRGLARISRADVADAALRCLDDSSSFCRRQILAH